MCVYIHIADGDVRRSAIQGKNIAEFPATQQY